MNDTATGRAASLSLAKDESGTPQLARARERLCQAAGGVFSHGTCQPAIDQTVVAQQCEAHGGVYLPPTTARCRREACAGAERLRRLVRGAAQCHRLHPARETGPECLHRAVHDMTPAEIRQFRE
jgi:hypothetical protein